jgi:hypothetical protein
MGVEEYYGLNMKIKPQLVVLILEVLESSRDEV